jgi:hypothetical protein
MRRRIVIAVLSVVSVVVTAGPAFATHDHFVRAQRQPRGIATSTAGRLEHVYRSFE